MTPRQRGRQKKKEREGDSHSETDREMDQEARHNAYQITASYTEGPGARAAIRHESTRPGYEVTSRTLSQVTLALRKSIKYHSSNPKQPGFLDNVFIYIPSKAEPSYAHT